MIREALTRLASEQPEARAALAKIEAELLKTDGGTRARAPAVCELCRSPAAPLSKCPRCKRRYCRHLGRDGLCAPCAITAEGRGRPLKPRPSPANPKRGGGR